MMDETEHDLETLSFCIFFDSISRWLRGEKSFTINAND